MIERYTPPNKLTHEPYGTIIKVISGERDVYYVQTSTSLKHPQWKPIEMILSMTFSNLLSNEEFIDVCLKLINNKDQINTERLIQILRR